MGNQVCACDTCHEDTFTAAAVPVSRVWQDGVVDKSSLVLADDGQAAAPPPADTEGSGLFAPAKAKAKGETALTLPFGKIQVPTPRCAADYGDASPVPQPSIVQIVFNHERSPEATWGLGFTALEGSNVLMVMQLDPKGEVAKWNDSQAELGNTTLQLGDRIVSVDGYTNVERMKRCLHENLRLSMLLERWPDPFTVSLRKGSKTDVVGLSVESYVKADGSLGVAVTAVHPGLVSAWNARARSAGYHSVVVTPACRVIEANGATDANTITELLKASMHLELKFGRPSPTVTKLKNKPGRE